MKTFIYTIKNKRKRKLGGINMELHIYRIKRNKPVYLGIREVCTAAYKGDKSEVFTFLHKNNHVSNKAFESGNGYYTYHMKDNHGIQIIEV